MPTGRPAGTPAIAADPASLGQQPMILSRQSGQHCGDPPGDLEVVDGMPEGGNIHQVTGVPSAFTPDYAPEGMFEIATKLYKASR
jgi:hypothetical protein